jgi:hypothetical protein
MSFRLGLNPSALDPRTLKLVDYISKVPPPPVAVQLYTSVKNWGMMLNDQLGDCVAAGAGHRTLQLTTEAGSPFVPADGDVLNFYRYSGYNPVDPSTDQGWDWLSALKALRKHGIGGHKAAAFVNLTPGDPLELREAIALFGNACIGFNLPDWCVPDDGSDWTKIPWVDRGPGFPPNPANGHAVLGVGYTPGSIRFVSWATVMSMDAGFYARYNTDAWAVLSLDWIEKNGESPSGFKLAQLQSNLAAITA